MRLFIALLSGGMVSGCSGSAPGNAETDRQARTLAEAVSFPRQTSAAGYEQALWATPRARSRGFDVLDAVDVRAKSLTDVSAKLLVLIHEDEQGQGFQHIAAVTACYRMLFNYYGVVGEPQRVACPKEEVERWKASS